MSRNDLIFYLLRSLSRLLGRLPHCCLRACAKSLGSLAYFLAQDLRKTALSNIALALKISRPEARTLAHSSFQHLCLTVLEYGYIDYHNGDVSSFATCLNPEQASALKKKHGGIIYVSAHQANWEVPFIETNTRACGSAVGRPLKTPQMTEWINSIRSSTGGSIVTPREAMMTAKNRLQQGIFFGFVGDQALPESSYSGLFLGRLAFSTSAPSLLAYKHNVPVVVALTCRQGPSQIIWYSPPIYPNRSEPLKKEVTRINDAVMRELEMGVLQAPEQWMWLHNRWKRPTGLELLKEYRYESILIIYPQNFKKLKVLLEISACFRLLYPHHDISVCLPAYYPRSPVKDADLYLYEHADEAKIDLYHYKLIFDFSSISALKKHYLRQAALTVLTIEDMCHKHALQEEELFADFEKYFIQTLYAETWPPTDFLQLIASKKKGGSPSQEMSTTT